MAEASGELPQAAAVLSVEGGKGPPSSCCCCCCWIWAARTTGGSSSPSYSPESPSCLRKDHQLRCPKAAEAGHVSYCLSVVCAGSALGVP
ncbi:hypothetical protein Y1Q_0021785 [Alligator mississippiensis]|uniref:Uncharacterized protein n=1 Tax=Alligator mississippiensis TaxID=8496 RepID=A0A151PBF2_ALLMI|nr:hypothetical protein Y1Q_0021785 [Alligator mississippiensis]